MRVHPYNPARRIGLGDVTGGWTSSAPLIASLSDTNNVTTGLTSSDVQALYGNEGYTGSASGTSAAPGSETISWPTAFNQPASTSTSSNPQSIPNTQSGTPGFSNLINSLFGSGNTKTPAANAANPLPSAMLASQGNTALTSMMPFLLIGLFAVVLTRK